MSYWLKTKSERFSERNSLKFTLLSKKHVTWLLIAFLATDQDCNECGSRTGGIDIWKQVKGYESSDIETKKGKVDFIQ